MSNAVNNHGSFLDRIMALNMFYRMLLVFHLEYTHKKIYEEFVSRKKGKWLFGKVSRIEMAIKRLSMTKQYVVYVFGHILSYFTIMARKVHSGARHRKTNMYADNCCSKWVHFFVSPCFPETIGNDSKTKMCTEHRLA